MFSFYEILFLSFSKTRIDSKIVFGKNQTIITPQQDKDVHILYKAMNSVQATTVVQWQNHCLAHSSLMFDREKLTLLNLTGRNANH